jgi:hypothetical protein
MSKSRNFNVLQKFENAHVLSPAAADWLTVAVDPFHDVPIHPIGWPDMADVPVVVSCQKTTFSVSQASATTTPWDCSIYFSPIIAAVDPDGLTGTYDNDTGVFTYTSAPGSTTYSGLIVSQTNLSGANTWPPAAVGSNSFQQYDVMPTQQDPYRVISAGFEVTNTTPELYKGGSVTAVSTPAGTYPNNLIDTASLPYAGSTYRTQKVTAIFNPPPSNSQEAILNQGALQWAAEKGVYMPLRFETVENPMVTGGPMSTIIPGTSPLVPNTVASADFLAGVIPPPLTRVAFSNASWASAFFTGLAPQTTLQITVHVYREVGVSVRHNAILVPLAYPSCPYDPLALELYARAIRDTPHAVPVGMNPAGEFWRNVMNLIKDAAPALGVAATPFLGPLAPLLGTLAGNIASTPFGSKNSKRTKKNPPINKSSNNNFPAVQGPQTGELAFLKKVARKEIQGTRLTKAERRTLNRVQQMKV